MQNISELIESINDNQYILKQLQAKDKSIEQVEIELLATTNTILDNKYESAQGIMEHFNKGPYNLSIGNHGITRYRNESLLKEIIQNIIDSQYNSSAIRIDITCDKNTSMICFKYNETGFRIRDIIAFFSLGHSNKSAGTTGAFGVGIKGALLTAEKIEIDSQNAIEKFKTHFIVTHIEKSGHTLEISNMQLTEYDASNSENETKLKLFVSSELYNELEENLLDITGKKKYKEIYSKCKNQEDQSETESKKCAAFQGKMKYLNPIELVFASLKKPEKNIIITVNKDEAKYVVNYSSDISNILFEYDSKNINFTVYVNNETDFKYLIPSRRDLNDTDMPEFIREYSYNLFSTYELTGMNLGEELPKFYVDIPTLDRNFLDNEDEKFYITEDRKGVQSNKVQLMNLHISDDIKGIIEKEKNYLYIQYNNGKKSWSYLFQYLYEYIEFQLKTNGTNKNWILNKQFLLENTLIKIDNKDINIADLIVYQYSPYLESDKEIYNKAKDIRNKCFMFRYLYHDFRNTKFDVNMTFHFVINGIEKAIESCSNVYDRYMSDYDSYEFATFKNKHLNLYDKILFELNDKKKTSIYLFDIQDGKAFNQSKLYSLLKVISINNEIASRTEYDDREGKFIVDKEEYPLVDTTIEKLLEVTIHRGASQSEEDTAKKKIENRLQNNNEIKMVKVELGNVKPINFKVDSLNVIKAVYNLPSNIVGKSELQKLLVATYIAWHMPNNWEKMPIDEQLKKFKEIDCTFVFDNSSPSKVIINVYIARDIKLASIDCSSLQCPYETIQQITNLINYSLLKNEPFDNRFDVLNRITDEYQYDITKVGMYLDNNKMNDAIQLLDNLYLCESRLNLGNENIIIISKNGIIIDVKQLKNINTLITASYDSLYIVPTKIQSGKISKIQKNTMNKCIDKMIGLDRLFEIIYKKVSNPIIKLIDQFDFKLKPIHSIDKVDIDILQKVWIEKTSYSGGYNGERNKFLFAQDISSKYIGYSCNCSVCGYDKTDIVNTYQIKEGIEYIEGMNTFKITLYSCANCFFESDSWFIMSIKFMDLNGNYSVSFSQWLLSAKNNQGISSNLMRFRIRFIKKSVYSIFDINSDVQQDTSFEEKEIILTPLMAVKWLMDNNYTNANLVFEKPIIIDGFLVQNDANAPDVFVDRVKEACNQAFHEYKDQFRTEKVCKSSLSSAEHIIVPIIIKATYDQGEDYVKKIKNRIQELSNDGDLVFREIYNSVHKAKVEQEIRKGLCLKLEDIQSHMHSQKVVDIKNIVIEITMVMPSLRAGLERIKSLIAEIENLRIEISYLLGVFISDAREINLFYNEILQEAQKNSLSKDDLGTQVTAHEIYHVLHYADVSISNGMWHSLAIPKVKSAAVVESLAEYFGFIYTWKYLNVALQNYIMKHMQLGSFPIWAYAGAKIIIDADSNNIGKSNFKYCEVFETSCDDIEKAYDKLSYVY